MLLTGTLTIEQGDMNSNSCMLRNAAILLFLLYKALLITHVKHHIRLRHVFVFVMPLLIAKHKLYI